MTAPSPRSSDPRGLTAPRLGRRRGRGLGWVAAALTAGAPFACTPRDSSDGAGGAGGAGGGGGAPPCPTEVAALFTLRVSGPGGVIPADLSLAVSWSAGEEPLVLLADPATYGDGTSNVICALVDPVAGEGGAGPASSAGGGGGDAGDDRRDLLCELWTSGPTRVVIEAAGLVPVDETLAPAALDGCTRPVPSLVTMSLALATEE